MPLESKIEILNALQVGASAAYLGRKYGVNESTIRSIKKCEDRIRRSASSQSPPSSSQTLINESVTFHGHVKVELDKDNIDKVVIPLIDPGESELSHLRPPPKMTSVADKLAILEELRNGASIGYLTKQYGVSQSAIAGFKRNEDKIKASVGEEYPSIEDVSFVSRRESSSSSLNDDGAPRRPNNVLGLEEKMDILDELANGTTARALGRQYDVNESTIRSIKKSEGTVRATASDATYPSISEVSFVSRRNTSSVSLPPKKKKIIALAEKIDILDELKSGATFSSLGRIYGVNESTIRSIKKSEVKIRAYHKNRKNCWSMDIDQNEDLKEEDDDEEGDEVMSPPQKRILLLYDKIQILNELQKGASCEQVAKMYGVSESAVYSLRGSEDEIRDNAGVTPGVTKQSRRDPILEKVERVLSVWIENQVQKGNPVNILIIRTKALELYETIKSENDDEALLPTMKFVASRNWIDNFMKRANLQDIPLGGRVFLTDGIQQQQDVPGNSTILQKNSFPRPAYVYQDGCGDGAGVRWPNVASDRVTMVPLENCYENSVISVRQETPIYVQSSTAVRTKEQILEEMSKEELLGLLQSKGVGDKPEENNDKELQITAKTLSEILKIADQLKMKIVEADPLMERIISFMLSLESAMTPYTELYKEIKANEKNEHVTTSGSTRTKRKATTPKKFASIF